MLVQGSEAKTTGGEAETAAAELANWRGTGEAQLQGEDEDVRDGDRRGWHAAGQSEDFARPARNRQHQQPAQFQ